MKNFIITLIIFTQLVLLKAQDSLSISNLEPLTHYFTINGQNRLEGASSHYLKNLFAESQITMLGEYHDSNRISKFTAAIIPVLDSLGYKNMILEVGPPSANYLSNLDSERVVEQLNELNKKYVQTKDDRNFTPIPFFSNVEDAQFLKKALEDRWNILGIDQEFIYSVPFWIDFTYSNLDGKSKKLNQDLYQETKDSIAYYYELYNTNQKRFDTTFLNSPLINEYFNAVSIIPSNDSNKNYLFESMQVYHFLTEKKWFENSKNRILLMKKYLRQELEDVNFNFQKDKILIKMGAHHVSKGFSPLRLFEIGNTLNELSEYNGNRAYNYYFLARYYEEEGTVKDVLESNNKGVQNLKNFIKMGRKDEWTIIDLRPLISGFYYNPQKYILNSEELDLIKRYNFLIILPTEKDPTPNF